VRRRKTKYIWLPGLGPDPTAEGDLTESNGFGWSCTSDSNNANLPSTIALFPLLEDTPQEAVTTANPDPNIVDFIGTDYVIKRIVGKCFVARQTQAVNDPQAVAVTAGFFVARAEETNPLLPVGASNNAFALGNYDPNYVDNIREPWIWRRTWILSNPSSTNATSNAIAKVFPSSNASYGSIQDGPHIDAKTGRRIRNDERLWFAATARGLTFNNLEYTSGAPDTQGVVQGYLDIRVLGALRRARNRSSF